jgi:hypothetical protein
MSGLDRALGRGAGLQTCRLFPHLFQLDEHSLRARWMNEGDERPFCPLARLRVHEPDAARFELCKGRVYIVDSQRDVMQARAAPGEVLRDGRIGGGGLEELESRVAGANETGAHVLRRDLLGRFDIEAERITIEGQRRRQIGDRDADVIENDPQ